MVAVPNVLEHDWFPRKVPDNVVLGEGSWLYSSFAFLHYSSRIPHAVRVGRNSGIYHGTFFELGPAGQVEIGNYCTLVGAMICTNRRIVIEDYTFIAHEVVLADTAAAVPFSGRPVSQPSHGSGVSAESVPHNAIHIGPNSWIGARAVLLAGAAIGEGTIIGAGSVVDFVVPPYAIVAGNPASIVGWAKPK